MLFGITLLVTPVVAANFPGGGKDGPAVTLSRNGNIVIQGGGRYDRPFFHVMYDCLSLEFPDVAQAARAVSGWWRFLLGLDFNYRLRGRGERRGRFGLAAPGSSVVKRRSEM